MHLKIVSALIGFGLVLLLSSCSNSDQPNSGDSLIINGGGAIIGDIIGPKSIRRFLNHLDTTNGFKFLDETDKTCKKHYNRYDIQIQASSPAIGDLYISSAVSDNLSVAWVESSRSLGVRDGTATLEVSIVTPLDTKERAAPTGRARFTISIDDGYYDTLNVAFEINTDHDINPPSVIRHPFYCLIVY